MKKLFSYMFLILSLEAFASGVEPVIRTLVWSDGTRYVGGVADGKRSGKGTIFWQDGTRFVGEFDNDKRNGPGTMIMPDGTIYSGIFSDDQLVEATKALNLESPKLSTEEKSFSDTLGLEIIDKTKESPTSNEPSGIALEVTPTAEDSRAGDTIVLIPEGQMPEISDDPYAPVTILTARIQSEVQEMINLWGAAWSEQNVPQYLSNYSDDFVILDSNSRRSWEVLRRDRLIRPTYIDVQITHEGMDLVAEDTIDALFQQTYRSNLYQDITKKILRLRREEKGWRIIQESTR